MQVFKAVLMAPEGSLLSVRDHGLHNITYRPNVLVRRPTPMFAFDSYDNAIAYYDCVRKPMQIWRAECQRPWTGYRPGFLPDDVWTYDFQQLANFWLNLYHPACMMLPMQPYFTLCCDITLKERLL